MNLEQEVADAVGNFQSYVIVQMINDWIRSSPNPQAMVNELLLSWRGRMAAMFDARAKQIFQQTGVIATDRDVLDQIAAEAEKRIRASFDAMLKDSAEVDELAKKHLHRTGVIQ